MQKNKRLGTKENERFAESLEFAFRKFVSARKRFLPYIGMSCCVLYDRYCVYCKGNVLPAMDSHLPDKGYGF